MTVTDAVCVTNDMHDSRPCTIRGEHSDICDGYEYRWAEEHRRYVATGKECHGCLPRLASNGLLCRPCWESLQSAENAYGPLAELLEEFDVLVVPIGDGGGGGEKARIPLSGTKIALNEISSYRGTAETIDLDAWVSRPEGAEEAVRFTRAVRGALRSFPTTEDPHRVPRVRCPQCELLSLMWRPPVLAGDSVRIDCRNPECGFVLDQDAFDKEQGWSMKVGAP
ncbi:hypothetical protein [Frigoribacterium sp. VKM Ac-2530]|uniref:hypothetical protein n=1 Tax=Frigoribacterium sp. VKM Ac-2530 TaxID=2783822 RepID=UPI00188A2BFC|nr:hypothetical protein [Frigoribacterium sp. VKM Ac-2530]MBF4578942.1 hypothetical protein [Frigoribacterium sp. VKM Ac-2530]